MGWTLLCKNEDDFGNLVLAHEVTVEGDKSKIMNVSVHILACWCIQTWCCFLPQAGMILGNWTYNSTHLHSFILYNYWFNRLSWSMLFNLGHGSYKISEKNHSWDYSADLFSYEIVKKHGSYWLGFSFYVYVYGFNCKDYMLSLVCFPFSVAIANDCISNY